MIPYKAEIVPNNRHERRFDHATYNTITGVDARLLEQIRYDSSLTAKRSPTRAQYSFKPQAYYAKCLGVCRATVNRRIAKLRKSGILEITRRRKLKGHWQTNLTKIRSWVWWKLGKLLQGLRKLPDPCNKPVTHSRSYEEKRNPEGEKGGSAISKLSDILASLKAKGFNYTPARTFD